MSGAAPVEGHLDVGCGLRLRSLVWTPVGTEVRARLVVVHGLGEHGGRYDEAARFLAGEGVAVMAWDQRGHGRSPGRRGAVGSIDELVDDVDAALEAARSVLPGEDEPFVLGHSMGGLIALRWVATRRTAIPGLILSAPWLGTAVEVPRWKRLGAAGLRRLVPRLVLSAGVDSGQLTRDPGKVREYDEDPLVHDRISAGLYHSALLAQERMLDGPPPDVPILLLVPLADGVADAAVSRAWGEGLGDRVRVEVFPDAFHEPLNDLGRESVFRLVAGWIRERAAGEPESADRVST